MEKREPERSGVWPPIEEVQVHVHEKLGIRKEEEQKSVGCLSQIVGFLFLVMLVLWEILRGIAPGFGMER